MNIEAKISNRHIHITKEDYFLLFGDAPFTKRNDLAQPGEFASDLTVTIKTDKNSISKVRVLGPCRNYTQVEISKTDSYTLGINPPIRESGDLEEAAEITIIGTAGEIIRKACIIPTRHIHLTKEKREELNLDDRVTVKTNSPKPTIFYGVTLREAKDAYFELHLDTDDANAAMLNQGDIVEIIK